MVHSVIDPRVIISLDYSDPGAAMALLDKLDPTQCRVKVGKELFTIAGPDIIRDIQSRGFAVFLDLKFHDIPTTVARACDAAADLGIWMLNVHAAGGKNMLLAAREALESRSQRPLLIAVTVLTSMSATDLEQTGINVPVQEQVVNLATLAHDCGLDGVVCSAHETGLIINKLNSDFKLVTPGIRTTGADNNDQSRVMTPAAAVQAGSHYLVIGRPVTRASDPQSVLAEINEEIRSVSVIDQP